MGEIYRARDPRLNRQVAVKVLLGEHTTRPGFSTRFEREAHALSNFSHPNICTVYDFGTHDGQHFLVMEYLEGETLASRLRRGPMRLEEFYTVALQLADALAEAHRHGHVHRDLKPENVMLTRTGVKLLDFGLVRFVGSNDRRIDGLTRSITTDGAIVGTIPYMSPEQLQGREADARSDIFSSEQCSTKSPRDVQHLTVIARQA
jgi:serine/threonine protein kinase